MLQRNECLHELVGKSIDILVVSRLIENMSIYNFAHFNYPENIVWAVVHEDYMGHWEVVVFEDKDTAWDYQTTLVKHPRYPDYKNTNLTVMYRDKQFGEGTYA